MQGTKTVQGFIRAIVWLTTFSILGYFLLWSSASKVLSGFGQMTFEQLSLGWVFLFVKLIFVWWFSSTFSGMFWILPEWERIILLRLGKFDSIKGPGAFIIPPFLYSAAAVVDMRITTQQVEATATLTKDNVPTKVTAAIEFEIVDPQKAIVRVKDYLSTVIWASTEALKNTIGKLELRELLGEREQIAQSLKTEIDEATQDYGINVRAVRITDIDTPQQLIEELAVIARAERSARAKKIQAEAEVEVAQKLAQAAKALAEPGALKIREIQALLEMSKEESTMVIIYPTGDKDGKAIASAAAGSQVKQF